MIIASLLSSGIAPPNSSYHDSRPPDVVHDVTPAAAAPLWRCRTPLPTGLLRIQKEAVAAVKQYAVLQGFAVSIYRCNRIVISASIALYTGKALQEIPQPPHGIR